MATCPAEFLCPITEQVMVDPVIDIEGHTYERNAIERWLEQNGTSPITQTSLKIEDLSPHKTLKKAIEEYQKSQPIEDRSIDISNNTKTSSLTVSTDYIDGFASISIQPPKEENRLPCHICCVIDTSGSMNDRAEIQNDKNEQYGLSQLDLVKHSLKTIIQSLQPQDRLSIVSFSSNARELLPLTAMNGQGKDDALAKLNNLIADGSTNLWAGLKMGIEILSKAQDEHENNSALFLLTDGCPNVNPPDGHKKALETLKEQTKFTCSVNTFGFGYKLDSQLLEEIAIIGNSGSYAFIPDGSFVGTIFVNAMTTLLATAATNVQLRFHNQPLPVSDYTKWYSSSSTETETSIELGTITFGQTKDLLIPMSIKSFFNYRVTLSYDTAQARLQSLTFHLKDVLHKSERISMLRQKFRLQFVDRVRTTLETLRQDRNILRSGNQQQTQTVMSSINALEEEMKKYTDGFIEDLHKDLTGQVREAFSKFEWFVKWGVHFLPSLIRAHLLQYCNNFKDPGVQHYGQGTLFSSIRDEMDSIFCSIPAPVPPKTQGITATPANMSVFYDPQGGCFHGKCTVALLNGTIKLIEDVKPGDRMAPHGGMVTYVVKTKCRNQRSKMVILENGLIITSWHPIRDNHRWLMPCSLVAAPVEFSCDAVYNFALDQGHTVVVNGTECVTLGHGFKDDIVRHSYYGTERVIEDLKKLDLLQNRTGIVEIDENSLTRHNRTGLVTGLQSPVILVH